MRCKVFRLAAVSVAAVLLLSATGCKNKEEVVSSGSTYETAPVITTTAPQQYGGNLLTGEQNISTDNTRPVAFMIDNYNSTIKQKNIDKADFYVEAETEGGIPRIMAVFGSVDRLPQEVGPVRSARTHFVKMAKALDAIYCHVGGSTQGKALIKTLGVTDLDSLTQVSSELKAVNGASEHTKVFPLSKIMSAVQSRKIATTTATKSPYTFGTKAGNGAGNTVQVAISGSHNTAFTYDAATGLYSKHRNNLSSPVHVSYEGNAIQVKNVIVMYDKKYQEDAGHISFTLESGSGLLVSGGTSREIKWSRTNNQLTFTETDGTALTVAAGKTYVLLTSDALKSKTVVG